MKRVELFGGVAAAVFGVLLLLLVPGVGGTVACLVGAGELAACVAGDSFTPAVGVVLGAVFIAVGTGTAGYALATA